MTQQGQNRKGQALLGLGLATVAAGSFLWYRQQLQEDPDRETSSLLNQLFQIHLGADPPSKQTLDDRIDSIVRASLEGARPNSRLSASLGLELGDNHIVIPWANGVWLPAPVVRLICAHMDFPELLRLSDQLPAAAAACAQSVLRSPEYLRAAALRGFGDSNDSETRIRAWCSILQVEQLKAQYSPVLEALVKQQQATLPRSSPVAAAAEEKAEEAEEEKALELSDDLDHNLEDYDFLDESSLHSDFLLQQLLGLPSEADTYIEKDVPRTTIAMHKDIDSYVMHRALFRVLHAYAILDEETSYCQGMNFVVGYFLRHLLPKSLPDSDEEFQFLDDAGEEVSKNHAHDIGYLTRRILVRDLKETPAVQQAELDAFWLLVGVLYRLDHRQFYLTGIPGVLKFQAVFAHLVRHFLPQLQRHLDQHDVQVTILSGWWMTIFTVRHLPLPTLNRCWDIFVAEGVVGLYRVCLGVLKCLEPALLAMDNERGQEQMLLYLSTLPDSGLLTVDKIIPAAGDFVLSADLIARIHRNISGADPESEH